MDAKVNQALRDLRAAVDNDDMPAETRSELRGIVDTVERALKADEADHEDGGLDHLQSAAARFEIEHPSLGESIRTIVHSLGSAGL